MRISFQLAALPLLFSVVTLVPAQQSVPASVVPVASTTTMTPVPVDDKFVKDHFGKEFTLMPEFPAMVADLNGDGIDDLVIAARAKSPMLDAGGMNYSVVDPYHTFWGYGDPKVTSAFTTEDPTRKSIVLLVIHGDGPDAWRAEKPKAKFVLINVPVKSVSLRRIKVHKKVVAAIGVEEYGGDQTTSAVFWEGNPKKVSGSYKYEPLGAALE